MKTLAILLFVGMLIACETEQILVEKEIAVRDTVWLEKTVTVPYTQYDTVTEYVPVYDTVYLTEEVIVIDTVYETKLVTETITKIDTVHLTDTEYVLDTVYVTQTVERIDTVYIEVVKTETVIQIDTVYVEQTNTKEYTNTITVPHFWKKYVDNFLKAVEECKFPLFPRDVVIDTTFHEPVPIWGGDTIIYAYSYMEGGTTGYDGYWYINIDILKKDCAEAIIYRELFHRLGGIPYAGDWRLWNHFIEDSSTVGYDSNKDQIMYQNFPVCLDDIEPGDYYRVRYLSDLLPCLR